jgi:hypothetical protein
MRSGTERPLLNAEAAGSPIFRPQGEHKVGVIADQANMFSARAGYRIFLFVVLVHGLVFTPASSYFR